MPRGKKKQRITLERLGEPRTLPTTQVQIDCLAQEWGSEGPWEEAWDQTRLLAQRFLATREDDPSVSLAWHHLLLAVGNFKRSTGPIIPCALEIEPVTDELSDFRIPGAVPDASRVTAGDSETWPHLTLIEGLAVPTATTLLAAIWPQQHIIVDWRVMTAAIGLGAGTSWTLDGLDDAYLPLHDSDARYWSLYAWFRDTVLATAETTGTSPGQVERALFRLDERTQGALPERSTWSQYHAEAGRQLHALKKSVNDGEVRSS